MSGIRLWFFAPRVVISGHWGAGEERRGGVVQALDPLAVTPEKSRRQRLRSRGGLL